MEDQLTNNRYTDKNYWENYYRSNRIEVNRINKTVGAYDEFWDKLVKACVHPPKTIIEIGAYPGRYIAYLAEKYKLNPTAFDFNSDITKIEECFQAFGVQKYDFIQEDFLTYTPTKKYDLVISNGFIEHFENFEQVMDLHCQYIAPGGALLMMIPNKRYLRKLYSLAVDYSNLKKHNLKVMNLDAFKAFGFRNQLRTVHLNYFGGFNYNVHQKLNPVQKAIHKTFRQIFLRLNPYIVRNPNKYLSSTIIGIFSKN